MEKIKFGILSTAKIGLQQVIPAIQQSKYCCVEAIASRSLENAQQCAKQHNIPTTYGAYEALLEDSTIDVIYNPLPNHLHIPWSVNTLQANKHILCEKPLGLNANEVQSLIAEYEKHPHLLAMEAFMYKHHPQWQQAKQLVQQEAIGTLTSIQTFFSYYNDNPQDIRNNPEIGGGALYDIGCYGVSTARFITEEEPHTITATMHRHPTYHTDILTAATLHFGNVTAQFICATQTTGYQRVLIMGTTGHIEIPIPFNPPHDIPTQIILRTTDTSEDNQEQVFTFPPVNQYTLQADVFAHFISQPQATPFPLSDALANMKVIDSIFAHTL